MPVPKYDDDLKREYARLWRSCRIRKGRTADVDKIVQRIGRDRPRYEKVAEKTGVPWWFIAAIHNMESSGNFNKHLHNGDPLTAKTSHVPAGRPPGRPPFTWERSAADALGIKKLPKWKDWSAPGVLYKLEQFNGFGYRMSHPEVLTPYLWSFSNHYKKGKWVRDGPGGFDPNAVSAQCGAAVILRRMEEKKMIKLRRRPA